VSLDNALVASKNTPWIDCRQSQQQKPKYLNQKVFLKIR